MAPDLPGRTEQSTVDRLAPESLTQQGAVAPDKNDHAIGLGTSIVMAPDTVPARPPLPDMDWIAACEAAQDVLREYGYNDDLAEIAAAKAVNAVWPILHEVAFAAGRHSVLDGATEVWRVARGDDTLSTHHGKAEAKRWAETIRREGIQDVRVEHRLEPKPTPWQPADSGAVWPVHDGTHHYLATACYHGLHHLCGGAQHDRGDPSAPHCKYCEAPCSCPKHLDPSAACTGAAQQRRHHPTCARPDDDSHLGWCGPNQ